MKTLIALLFVMTSMTGFAAEEFDSFFDEIIQEQEREVQELKNMRKEFLKKQNSDKKTLRDRVTDLREKLGRDFRKFRSMLDGGIAPEGFSQVEIRENADSYDVTLDTQGMPQQDVTVKLNENDLLISGSSKNKSKTGNTTKIETRELFQEIHLNHRPDPKSLKVEFRKGIMNVHLNKAEI